MGKPEFFPLPRSDLKSLSRFDRWYFDKVWKTASSVYVNRIKALGFEKLERVLDAGCGFGQWSVPLAQVNGRVYSIDQSSQRVKIVKKIAKKNKIRNIYPTTGSIEKTKYPDHFFDAIFCYSAIYFTDYRKTIREFSRILKPGGRLYVCSNGLGWYLFNLERTDQPSGVFDTAQMSVDTLIHTVSFLLTGKIKAGHQLITPSETLRSELNKSGFKKISIRAEGTYCRNKKVKIVPFFNGKYKGIEGVFEIIANKKQ